MYKHTIFRNLRKTSRTFKSNESTKAKPETLTEDEIVISGISGRFPNSNSMEEFKLNLLSGHDMLTEQTRFKGGRNLPPRFGLTKSPEKFDADFFCVSDRIAQTIHPSLRILLEVTYEAIVEAGINPTSLRGSKTGVYVAYDGAEVMSYWKMKHGSSPYDGYTTLWNLSFIHSNQLSHLFDFKGTSLTLNTGCSSSLFALETAVMAMRSGKVDRAIVGAASIYLVSTLSDDLNRLGALSPTGYCKPFDKDANGYVRSEAVVSILLEKERDAKRNYGKVRTILTSSDGMKKDGIFRPSASSQEDLYRRVCTEANIDPAQVYYVECHGTGTQVGDPEELRGLANFYGKALNRTQPLLVGSVKGNMGHTECASGLVGIAKLLVSAQEGVIPANVHFNSPNEHAADLFGSLLEVVTENRKICKSELVGVSAFGFGGTSGHVILELNSDPKSAESKTLNSSQMDQPLPVLVALSGRTEKSVELSVGKALSLASNPHYRSLLHRVFKERIQGHDYRAFGVISQSVSSSEAETLIPATLSAKVDSHEKRPLWLVFSGMGSQWSGMGAALMRIHPFQESVQRSKVTLKNAGVDLDGLLEPNNQTIFQNVRDALNSIAVMQVALYDTLMSLGVLPDGFFGHSFGEIICAYADGVVTAEEALLLVDARGRAILDAKLTQNLEPGAMAAVGLPLADLKLRCPPDVSPACHNGPKNVTVAGPKGAVADFVDQLQAEGVFAQVVNTCNFASHAPIIEPAANLYLKYMQDIIKGQGQRSRSKRWVSTSLVEPDSSGSSGCRPLPEYFVNNLVSPVLFHEAVGRVPRNAVVLEMAPKGLLHGILRSSLPDSCDVVAPMSAEEQDRLLGFFTSLGNMYNAGVDMNLGALYPEAKFPVGARTPSLNSLLSWKHEKNWIVPLVENTAKYVNGILNVDINEISFKYLEGHKLDDRIVFPAAGYLVFAWQTLASILGSDYQELPVAFKNIFFENATFLSRDEPTQLRCSIHEGTGNFEIHEKGVAAVKGTITSQPKLTGKRYLDGIWKTLETSDQKDGLLIDPPDLYKELMIRGHDYQGEFRSVKNFDIEGHNGVVTWKDNWTTFLDSVLQVSLISESTGRHICVPTRLESATINPQQLLNHVRTSGNNDVPVLNRPHDQKYLAPGVELHKISSAVIRRQRHKEILHVSEYKFSPYLDTLDPNMASALPRDTSLQNVSLSSLVDIVLENTLQNQVQVCDMVSCGSNWVGPYLSNYLSLQPKHEVHFTTMSTEAEIAKIRKIFKESAAVESVDFVSKPSASDLVPERSTADLVIVDDLKMIKAIGNTMRGGSYIILRDGVRDGANNDQVDSWTKEAGLHKVAHQISKEFNFSLLKKLITSPERTKVQGICMDSKSNLEWLPTLQTFLTRTKDNSRVYLYAQNDPESGVVGLAKCLAREPGCEHIRCILDPQGKLILNFDQPDPILSGIIQNDMLINVYQNDRLGAFRHVNLRSPVLNEPTKPVTHAFVKTLSVGDLSSLNWIESPLNLNADPKHLYTVNYASLNLTDLMLSTGKLPLTPADLATYGGVIGGEFTGMNPDGRRVMAIAVNKTSLATTVHLNDDQGIVWDVPHNWSLEDAATVPVAYATAYYSLLMKGGMQPGQSVLIHSGTGGVGQAAINVARSINCDIFTTVGTSEKREKLKKLFPFIKDDQIGNSRDCTFENQFLQVTSGKGVDFVLNSLADDKLFAGLRCLAAKGTFIEIGKFNINKAIPLGMNHLQRNVVIMAVDLLTLILSSRVKPAILEYLREGLKTGVVQPLERTVFKQKEVEEAFRYMAKGNHVGKVLISVNAEDNFHHQSGRPTNSTKGKIMPPTMAVPRSYFHPKKAYVVLGGLGGVGLELADWLITRGAQHVVLLSRSGVTNGYQNLCIKRWTIAGVQVDTNSSDLVFFDTATKFMEFHKSRGVEMGGIFNCSMVLRDGIIGNQTSQMYQAVAAPKVTMTRNLDILSRQFYPDMDYFVCFSSMASGVGNSGVSNYGWANSSMENICKIRNEAGFHGASVQWGVIGDVGHIEKISVETFNLLFHPQRISSCMQSLDTILQHSKTSAEHFKCYASYVVAQNTHRNQRAAEMGLPQLVARLCFIKNVNDESMQIKTLAKLGLDSLSGLELQRHLKRNYDLVLSIAGVRNLQWQDLKAIADGTFSSAAQSQTIKIIQEVQGHYETILSFPEQIDDVERALVQLQEVVPEGEKAVTANLFVVPGGDAKSSRLLSMANKLKCNVYAFQCKNIGVELGSSIKKMADTYIQDLKFIQPSGPYNLAGYSFGGAVAFEMAQQLSSQHNDQVENLILLDGYLSVAKEKRVRESNIILLNGLQYVLKFSDNKKKTYQELLYNLDSDKCGPFFEKLVDAHSKSESTEARRASACMLAARSLLLEYEPSPGLDAKVHYIMARDSLIQQLDESPETGFQKLCENSISIHNVSGNHATFLEEPFVQQTAAFVNNILGTNNNQQLDTGNKK